MFRKSVHAFFLSNEIVLQICLFRAFTLDLQGNGGLEKQISKTFTHFVEKITRTTAAECQGVCMNDIPISEDLVQVNIPTQFDYYVTTDHFVVPLITMYYSKLIAAHRVIFFPTAPTL